MGRRRRRVDPADAARALPEALAALSRTLPAGPSPETFRRAKFDLPEAAPALWQLLFRVLSQLRAGGSTASPAPEAQARWVKSELLSQGYPRQGLTQLPEDGSRGSRELLLALSWLLAREPLPEQLLAQTRVHLGDEMPVCECDILASPGLPAPGVEADGPVDIRHLQWLMGKLRFRWRTLMASQQEQCALLGKIHWFTRGCHSDRCLGHLSVAETELLRDPESGQQDTVLGACPLEAPQPSSVHRPCDFGTEELQLQLQALQEELRVAAGARRAAWEARVGGQGPECTIAQQAAQEAVGQELVVLQQAWEQGGGLARAHGPHRLVRTEAGVPAGLGLQAAQVIRVLQSRETCLEEMLRQLQAQCQQQLARLAEALPSLIWILPPGR
ncbi:tubulin epsilon and delta complex protein 1 isoform X2 [Sturnira hondurensis]|uniref:tubulin epsilon and delta complex protein 1 isoform X2 n=1 Tax=Sturnira hondurensis TaxID=192404 RepID=UPI00187AED4C|nr:tubulin epsilon and delta complex protein 1 isoform X2 [Sturnira hondurensis]